MRPKRRRLFAAGARCLGALLVLVFAGCATTGRLLSPEGYAGEGVRLRAAAERGPGPTLAAAERLVQRPTGSDGVLPLLEMGRLRGLGGELEGSVAAYEAALEQFEAERQRPVVQASEAFFSSAALATNDRALPYQSAAYERLMAHNFLAWNYLRLGAVTRAQIALNGAIAEMDYLRDRQTALREAGDRQLDRAGVAGPRVSEALAETQQRLRASARPELRTHQSAFTFYLAAVLFSLEGDTTRSEIALRRAGELYPEHPAIARALTSGFRSDPKEALIVVLVADGWVSLKDTAGLPFIWDGTLLQIAMPVYGLHRGRWGATDLELHVDGRRMVEPAVIADLDAQARAELADRYPAIFIRQVLRLVTKYQIQQRLEREHPLAGFAAQIFNLLTDGADTRSWSTLPATLQVGHASVSPGRRALAWGDRQGVAPPTGVDLPPGSTLFLLVNQFGGVFSQDWALFDSDGQLQQPASSALSSQPTEP